MRPPLRRTALLALASAVAVVAVASRTDVATAAASPDEHSPAAYAVETARIRAHFDSVLAELHAADIRALTPARRAARAAHIERLRAYRDRGVFPHNHDFAGARVPYFVDHRGVHCAVGHLLQQSGRSDIVARVRAADNHVRVPALASDSAFMSWLDASGLTLAEAARIQPWYGELPPEEPQRASDDDARIGVALLSSALSATSIVWNAKAHGTGHRGVRAALGYAAAAVGMAVAIDNRDASDGTRLVGIASGTLGVGSAAMATRTLLRRGKVDGPAGPASPRETSTLTVAPALLAAGDRMAPGVAVSLRF